MRALGVALLGLLILPAPVRPQVEIDRTLQRVYGTAIMSSDVRQARLLKLGTPAAPTDEAIQTMLENRILVLREVARGGLAEPPADRVAARRSAWAASWPAGTDLAALMTRAGMSERALDTWFRDDLLMEAYIDQRFGQASDARRASRVADWIRDLRHRANLPVK